MDISTSTDSLSAKSVKRKFMQWAWKWFYTNSPTSEEFEKPDATPLICLLQSIGFQLHKFEKSEVDDNKNTKTCENNVKVTIECGESKMKAILELNDVNCQCPNNEETLDASFWSVSGTGATGSVDSVNKLVETGSNLLPKVDRETHRMIHDITYRLLSTINPKLEEKKLDATHNLNDDLDLDWENKPKDIASPLTRCYTQPVIVCRRRAEQDKDSSEILPKTLSTTERRFSMSTQELTKTIPIIKVAQNDKTPILLRQKTWDIDQNICDIEPRPSPPKTTSTPVIFNELYSSFGQISLQSDDLGIESVENCLQKAKFYIEKAQKLQFRTLNNDDSVFVKPSTPIRNNTPRNSRSPVRPPGSRCPSPSLSVKSMPQNPIIRRSLGGMATTPKSQLTTLKPSITPKLPLRGRSLGGASPAVKQAVGNAQKKVAAAKLTPVRSTTPRSISSSSSSLSTTSATSANGFTAGSATPAHDSKLSVTRKRYSTTAVVLKPSILPVMKNQSPIKVSTDNSKMNTSARATPSKLRTPTSVPVKRDANTTLPAKFGYTYKK